ncbi:MAG: 50S ribosomal protein L9 [Bacteroidetes bacterium HGW-Bacteroidetes-6]|jgi:large subunit ribosomal protein L9|nr:MAG: 50S ribosomal protein L9 [Bacteroidetes bacterium HGW-Bacteroidetes-6]
MEVILKQDVKNLGYADDIVNVKPGYGRNYLIPNGLAAEATSSAKKVLAENLKQRSFKEDKIRQEAEALSEKLKDVSLVIKTKAATTGKIFGSVNNIQIADALKEQHNFDIDRKKIDVNGEAIKELGTYKAKVNLYKDIKSEITLEVIAEE